jgi:electron transfer flavoprotein alpha subunit
MTKNQPSFIAVVVEHDNGDIRPVTYELLAVAREIQRFNSGRITAIILGRDVRESAARIAQETGCDITAVSDEALQYYNGETFKYFLKQILDDIQPEVICIANSSQGSDFAPGLSVQLNAACITQVESVTVSEGKLLFSRRIFGGKIQADIRSNRETVVLTLQPGAMVPVRKANGLSGEVVHKKVTVAPQKSKTISKEVVQTGDVQLHDAKVVISAGRGIGDETQLPLIYQLGELIPHAVVCGSRPVIDMGWLPHGRQIGVTGATISPELYLACGISGAEQHISGMRGSDFIVSINRDPTAAIFHISDICIVEDLKTFIPAVINELQNKGKATQTHE